MDNQKLKRDLININENNIFKLDENKLSNKINENNLVLNFLIKKNYPNKIEIEIFDELKKQTEKDISGNAHRRRERWTDKKRLRLIVRKIDKTLLKKLGGKPSRQAVEIEFQLNYKDFDTDKLIKPLNFDEDYFDF